MIDSPSPLPSPTPPGDRNRWAKWMRLGLISGGVVLLLIIVGTLIARALVYRRLGPIVETSIGTLIDRPVELGPITGFSLTGIRIDGAAIPPTVEDEDYAKVPEVEVSFNPVAVVINVVRDRTVPITLTFRDPELYLQEDEDGHWVELEIKRPEQEAPISLALDTIKARNATVIVAPFPQSPYDLSDALSQSTNQGDGSSERTTGVVPNPVAIAKPVTFVDIDVDAHLRDENRYLDADIIGKAAGGGRFELTSDVDFNQLKVNAHLRSQNMHVTQFNDLVKAFAPLPATLQAGEVDTNLTVRYRKESGVSCEGTAQVNDVDATVDLSLANVDFQSISEVNSLLRCSGQTISLNKTALKYGTLPINASGSVDLESGYDLTAQVAKLTLEQIQETIPVDVPVEIQGAVGATVAVSGPLTQPLLTGTVRTVDPVQVDQLVADQVSAGFTLTPTLLDITQLTVLPAVGGEITGKGQVTFQDGGGLLFDAKVQAVPTDAIASLYNITLPDPFQLGRLNSTIDVFGDFSNVQAVVQWRLPNATYPGQGEIMYGDQTLRVRNTTVQAPGGRLGLTANAFLAREEWDATVAIDGVDVPTLLAQMAINPLEGTSIQGTLSSDIALGGNFRQLTPEAITFKGNATLAEAEVGLGGTPILDRGDWRTDFQWTGQDLIVQQFTAPGVDANGVISTNLQTPITPATAIRQMNLNVAVAPYDLNRLQAFIPDNIQAQVQQQLAPRLSGPVYPQGQAQFEGTLTGTLTQPQLDGTAQLDNLAIASFHFGPTLTGPINFALGQGGAIDLQGGGNRLYARLDERYLPAEFEIREGAFSAIGTVEGDRLVASINSFDVATLAIRPLPRPDLGPVQGIINLDVIANIADLAKPKIESQITIERPGLGAIAADVFTGHLSYRDGIAVLDDGVFCLGNTQPETTQPETTQPETSQNNNVASPSPHILVASAPLAQSTSSENRSLEARCHGKSQFRLASVVNVFDLAVEHSQLTIQNGDIQDILAILQWYDIEDARRWLDFNAATFTASAPGSAVDVVTDTVALPPTVLLDGDRDTDRDKLGYFSQWLAQWQQTQDQNHEWVPSLQDLAGQFDGTLSLDGSVQTGFNLKFDVMGDRWTWGPYDRETQFTASGSVSPNAITLTPLQLTNRDAKVIVEGQVGLNQPGTTTVEVQNVPVGLVREVAQQFVPNLETLPIHLDGTLHTQATLNGTLFNPTIEGTVVVDDPQLNDQPLEQAVIHFAYDQARLTAGSIIALQSQEKLTLDATIPYALPFMAVQPSDDRIDINVNVRDQGLALINLFTQDQATWEGGTGDVNLGITGTLNTPLILGTLRLKDGQISSPHLTQPITGITGTSEFNRDRVTLETFQAQLGSGTVVVQGELPLFAASAQSDGLAVDIDTLPLNVKDLLSATVDGELFIKGMAIAPIVSGDIGVFRGRVDVAGAADRGGQQEVGEAGEEEEEEEEEEAEEEEAGFDGHSAQEETEAVGDVQEPNPLLERVTLDGLNITLEDQLQIARRPLFDIETTGGLTVTGTLADPRVQGDIELASGWINLFATQFRLDRNKEHVARFRANRALTDPFLDVSMNAVVREVERSPVPPSSPFARPEVSDQSSIPTFGGLQSVIITARVNGSAQHLLDHLSASNSQSPNPLTLTSSPSRSERQLVALLGGEIFNALESGNTGLAIASYVGSGFVAGVGDQIADALGLSEFSIFPTTDISGEARLPLTVGVEAGLDIIPQRLSFSILEVLDGTTNPQYGLRYRLGDRWQVRGSTDLNQDNRAILEFRNDF